MSNFRKTQDDIDLEIAGIPPMQGVGRYITDVVSKINEEEGTMFSEMCVSFDIDPDALMKTAKLNSQLQQELRAATEALPRWVSVKERYPSENGEYLCCWESRFGSKKTDIQDVLNYADNLESVDPDDFYGDNRPGFYSWNGEYGYYEVSCVSHWMPLPEPPKEESDEEN